MDLWSVYIDVKSHNIHFMHDKKRVDDLSLRRLDVAKLVLEKSRVCVLAKCLRFG